MEILGESISANIQFFVRKTVYRFRIRIMVRELLVTFAERGSALHQTSSQDSRCGNIICRQTHIRTPKNISTQNMKNIIVLFFLSINALLLTAQPEANLAQQYLNNGEYEKAAAVFEQLTTKYPENDYFFGQLVKSLSESGNFEKATEVLKAKLKKNAKNASLQQEYGFLLEKQDKPEEAKDRFEKTLEYLPAEQGRIFQIAQAFQNGAKLKWAAQTYEKGAKLLGKDTYTFSYELAGIYQQMGDSPKMIEYYLNSIEENPTRMPNVQSMFQRAFGSEEMTEVQTQLFDRSQKQPDNLSWPEMLSWIFVQRKDYKNAFRQIIAIDKRFQENGTRVYKLAQMARNEKLWDAAADGFRYIVDQKGKTCPFYLNARQALLATQREKLTEGYQFDNPQLLQLAKDYETFFEEFGKTKATHSIMSEYAKLQALYLKDLPKAIAMMNEVIALPFSDRNMTELESKCLAKIELGDYYLMSGDEWEASLLYSQVDKQLKDSPTGEIARFKNAKLSYYQGDFEWAQGQLDALKASTSELISNDAIDLSVFIMEHYGLDTIARPMEMFARAEMLNFQNRFEESFVQMDSIDTLYPKHPLGDDIMYVKADICTKKTEYAKAIELYEKIVKDYADGILVDNAIFKMAQLYEGPLNDKEKAKTLYEKIIQDYASSIYVIEARKRFRFLRGDVLEGVQ